MIRKKVLISLAISFIVAMLLVLVLFIGVSIFPVKPVRAATTWYVDGATGSDITGTGTLAAPWKTISHAVTDVAVLADDTIMVAAGTYNEEVDITKALSIIGAGAATTIIDGTGVPPQATGLVAITAPGNVLFTGFTVKNAYSSTMNGASHNRFEIYASGAVSGVTYTISYCNLYGTNNPLEDQDYGFYNYGDSANVVFTHNMITQTGANAILVEVCTGATEISYNTLDVGCYGSDAVFFMAYGSPTPLIVATLQNVSYNTFNMGTGGPFDYSHRATGVSFCAPGAVYGVGDGGFTNMVISSNTFNDLQANRRAIGFWNNNGASSVLSGAQVTHNIVYGIGALSTSGVDFYGITTNTMISCNTILNTAVGIYLRNGDAPGTTINNNNIVGNTVGVDWTLGSAPVNAEDNWWGSASGPSPIGTGDPVTPSTNVVFTPWLTATAPCADFQLAVSSAYDLPNPAVGINYELPGSSVTASVTTSPVFVDGTRYICTGWSGTGSVPTSGTAVTVTFTITQDSSINWLWSASAYDVSFTETGSAVAPTVSYSNNGSPSVVGTVPFNVWVDSGSSIAYSYESPVAGTSGTRYVLTNTSPASSQTITAPLTVLGTYKTQYDLEFAQSGLDSSAQATIVSVTIGSNTPINVAYGDFTKDFGFVDAGTTITYTFASTVASSNSGEQFVLTTPAATPASGFSLSGATTVTGTYKTQYYLTVQTSPSGVDSPTGQGWYDAGSSASISTAQYQDIVPSSSRYRFNGWTTPNMLEITNPSLTSTTVLVDNAKTVTADYVTQYHVTFAQSGVGSDFLGTVVTIDSSNYGVSGLPVSFWWDAGSGHSFSFASPLAVNATQQYVWISTSGLSTSQSDPLTVTASGSVVGNYAPQNAITFAQSGVGSDFTGTVVTVDGTPYGVSSLPVSFYWTMGSAHSFAFQSPLATANADQYVWNGTTGLSSVQNGPMAVTANGTIVGNYKTQYHLTVSYYSGLVPAPTPSSGWFDAGSQVMLTAPQTGHDPQGTFYAFHGVWTVNGLDIKGNTVQITMNSSTVVIAWYVDPPPFGDVNNDGRVDLTDLVLVARHYGTSLGDPGYSILYDLNGDGRIDLLDLAAVARAIQP